MTIDNVKQAIIDYGNDIYFDYKGKSSGIEPTVD
jgi:hypothetical protein